MKPVYLYTVLGILLVLGIAFFFYSGLHSLLLERIQDSDFENIEEQVSYTFTGFWPEGYELTRPNKIVRGPSGKLYVSDRNTAKILIFSPRGQFIEGWQLYEIDSSPPYRQRRNKYDFIEDIAVDSKAHVYAVFRSGRTGETQIQKYNSTGELVRLFNSYESQDGPVKFVRMHPNSITLDASGNFYAADERMHTIFKFDGDGNLLKKWGGFGFNHGEFSFWNGASYNRMAIDKLNNLYVCDIGNHRIQKFDAKGNYQMELTRSSHLLTPAEVLVSPGGKVYVSDERTGEILIFSAKGHLLGTWGKAAHGKGMFDHPTSMLLDPAGRAFVVTNKGIMQFTAKKEE